MMTGARVIALCAAVLTLTATLTAGRGAGRAFPIAAENSIQDSFERINPEIEWDPTNFLVDLAGHYANCKALRKPMGVINVDRLTPEGDSIVAVVGSIQGTGTDVLATAAYIEELIKRWLSSRSYHAQILNAKRFGCSVRPGCDGNVVVACLFGSSGTQKDSPAPVPYSLAPTTTRKATPPAPTTTTTTTTSAPTTTTTGLILGEQRALAFTVQQYDVAANVLGKVWDQSHYLENLSGFETDCSMIDTTNWSFEHTNRLNRHQGLDIKGQYGYALNRGSTPDALVEILSNPTFKNALSTAKDLGCSLIPDCIKRGEMYVVVSCLHEQ